MKPEIPNRQTSQNTDEPRGALYILLSVFAFLSGLFLAKLQTPTARLTSMEDVRDIPSRVVPVAETDNPPLAPKRCDSAQTPKRWWKRWKIWKRVLYVATFFLVGAYAYFTYVMWRSVNRTNILTEQSLRLQNHPWIKITRAELVGQQLSAGGLELRVSYTVENYGNSPAVRLFSNSKIHTRDTINVWNHDGLCGQHYKVWSEKDYPFSLPVFPSDVLTLPVDSANSSERGVQTSQELWIAVCVGYLDMSRAVLYNTKNLYVAKPIEGQKSLLPIDHFEFVAAEPYEQYERPEK
jgi:hypothetical protein